MDVVSRYSKKIKGHGDKQVVIMAVSLLFHVLLKVLSKDMVLRYGTGDVFYQNPWVNTILYRACHSWTIPSSFQLCDFENNRLQNGIKNSNSGVFSLVT